jgi:diguanylate cyclase (GGDEF)-like protein
MVIFLDVIFRNLDSRKDNDAKISNEQHSFNFFGKDYSFTIQRVLLHNFNGKTEGEVLVLSDLSDEYERVRNQYNEKFSNVLKNAYAEIIELDFHTNSAKFLSDTGHLFDFSNIFKVQDEMELKELRKRMREYVYTDDYDMYDKFFDYDIISAYFADNIMTMMESEIRILNRKNHYSWLRFSISQIKNSNGIITYLCCVKDIDEEKKAEKDSLSTVFNRGAFVKNVKNKLSMRNKAEACAFYMIDIDNFKSINDNYGHNVGDLVIRNIGKIINDIFANKAVPGRMGGDEFAVYQDGIEKTSVVYELADSILEKVHNVAIDMKLHDNVTVSIGAVIVTDGDVSFDKIYQEADKQLYCSKRKSKNCYTVSEVRL